MIRCDPSPSGHRRDTVVARSPAQAMTRPATSGAGGRRQDRPSPRSEMAVTGGRRVGPARRPRDRRRRGVAHRARSPRSPCAATAEAADPATCGSISRMPLEPTAEARDAVLARPLLEGLEGGQLVDRRARRPACRSSRYGDPVLLAVRPQQGAPSPAERRLERSGRVVEAGVDDAAVVPGLVGRDARLLLEDGHLGAGIAPRHLARDGEAHDPGPDDANGRVASARRHAPSDLNMDPMMWHGRG